MVSPHENRCLLAFCIHDMDSIPDPRYLRCHNDNRDFFRQFVVWYLFALIRTSQLCSDIQYVKLFFRRRQHIGKFWETVQSIFWLFASFHLRLSAFCI